jgi:hypothetical protein
LDGGGTARGEENLNHMTFFAGLIKSPTSVVSKVEANSSKYAKNTDFMWFVNFGKEVADFFIAEKCCICEQSQITYLCNQAAR